MDEIQPKVTQHNPESYSIFTAYMQHPYSIVAARLQHRERTLAVKIQHNERINTVFETITPLQNCYILYQDVTDVVSELFAFNR